MNFNRITELSYALLDRHIESKSRHFSFILYKNKIVSIGFNNTRKTHPRNIKNSYLSRENTDISEFVGTHSELAAVIKYGWEDLSGHIMVNTRINRAGELANSRPCSGCQNLIQQLNIKTLYYTDHLGNFVEYNENI